MKNFLQGKRTRCSYKIVSFLICLTFVASLVTPPITYAQSFQLNLPAPGTMIAPSPAFTPPILRGIKVDPNNPLKFSLIVDSGDSGLKGDELKGESEKFARYFLAALTISEDDLWVNLSPYEKDRIVSEKLGETDLGRDLLAQDYVLKQLASSLIYPESELGKVFWNKVYQKAHELYGTTEIPINTFNRVWVVPDQGVVYEAPDGTAYVVVSHLKVMLEEDYMALNKSISSEGRATNAAADEKVKELSRVSSPVVREVIIPAIEKEVNEGKNFAQLRQVNNAVVLAAWFKKALKNSLLGQVYADKGKVAGVNLADSTDKDKIYDQYLQAFQKGSYNYIKQDYDQFTQQTVSRKYFSGGYGGRAVVENTRGTKLGTEIPKVGQVTFEGMHNVVPLGNLQTVDFNLVSPTSGDMAALGESSRNQGRAAWASLNENAQNTNRFVSQATIPSGLNVSQIADQITQAKGHQAFELPADFTPQQITLLKTELGTRDRQFEAGVQSVNDVLDQNFPTIATIASMTPDRRPAIQSKLVDDLVGAATKGGIIVNPRIREEFNVAVGQAIVSPKLDSASLKGTLLSTLKENRPTNLSNVPLIVSAQSPFVKDFAGARVASGFQVRGTLPAEGLFGPVARSEAYEEIQGLKSFGPVSVLINPEVKFSTGINQHTLGTTENVMPFADVVEAVAKPERFPQSSREKLPASAHRVDELRQLEKGNATSFAQTITFPADIKPNIGESLPTTAGEGWAREKLPVSRDTKISIGGEETTYGAFLDSKPANFRQINDVVLALNGAYKKEAGLKTYSDTIVGLMEDQGKPASMIDSWKHQTKAMPLSGMQDLAGQMGFKEVSVSWNKGAEIARNPQGHYQMDASDIAVAYAKSGADNIGIETSNVGLAQTFADNFNKDVKPIFPNVSLGMGSRLSAAIPPSEMPEMAKLGFSRLLDANPSEAPRVERAALAFQSPINSGIAVSSLSSKFDGLLKSPTTMNPEFNKFFQPLNIVLIGGDNKPYINPRVMNPNSQKEIRFILFEASTASNNQRFPELASRLTDVVGVKVSPQKLEEVARNATGGINLGSSLVNLEIKRDGNGVPLPINMQPIMNMDIQGFTPTITNMTPVTSLPLLLGSNESQPKTTLTASN